jgi:small subunit ribosomal protein S17
MTKKTSSDDAQGATEATPATAEERKRRKSRVGLVVSNKMDKTVTVVIERRVAHAFYGKQQTRTKKFHAHDDKNEYKVGDVVRIVETRPLSKTKRWRVAELLERPE